MDPGRLADVARAHGLDLVIQFGSTVSGRTHAASDLDLAVRFVGIPDTLDAQSELIADLQALVPGCPVDLVVLNRADPLLLKQVADTGLLLFGRPARFQELKLYAFKRYQDHRRFLRMERAYVERTIAALGR